MKINFNDPLYAQAKNILLLSVDQKKPGPLEVDDVVRAIFDELAQGFVNVGILPKGSSSKTPSLRDGASRFV